MSVFHTFGGRALDRYTHDFETIGVDDPGPVLDTTEAAADPAPPTDPGAAETTGDNAPPSGEPAAAAPAIDWDSPEVQDRLASLTQQQTIAVLQALAAQNQPAEQTEPEPFNPFADDADQQLEQRFERWAQERGYADAAEKMKEQQSQAWTEQQLVPIKEQLGDFYDNGMMVLGAYALDRYWSDQGVYASEQAFPEFANRLKAYGEQQRKLGAEQKLEEIRVKGGLRGDTSGGGSFTAVESGEEPEDEMAVARAWAARYMERQAGGY